MTLINVASSIIYTKGAPLREKIQTYGLALVFLVLLYNSPSGLVFYWVFNQIFSLCKNIVLKMKHPGRIVHAFLSAIFVLISIYFLFFRPLTSPKKKIIVYAFTLIFVFAPLIISVCRKKRLFSKVDLSNILVSDKQNFLIFLTSCLSLSLLCGMLLPSNVIATSPSEFSFLGSTDSPLTYIWSSLAYFTGLFLFWPLVIYKMFSDNKTVKAVMPVLFFVLAMCALANAFIFKYNYGTMSIFLKLDNSDVLRNNSLFFSVLPIFLLCFILAIFFIFEKLKLKKIICVFIISICLAQFFIGTKNCISIKKTFIAISEQKEKERTVIQNESSDNTVMYNLSKTEPNVFVLFLDRAISSLFPYILEQFPELKSSFDGFTYCPNTISFGEATNSGTPAMLGGYDYTVDEINKRSTELLKEKHNEALKVLPLIFSEAGYESSIFDLPYEDYDSGKNIWEGTEIHKLKFPNKLKKEFYERYKYRYDFLEEVSSKNVYIFMQAFSLLQIMYPPLRRILYGGGRYYKSSSVTIGPSKIFMDSYMELYFLKKCTSFSAVKPTFHYIQNVATHEYCILPKGFTPQNGDDNYTGVAETGSYKVCQEEIYGDNDLKAYHVNAMTLLKVGEWLDYLKENAVYDNTRVIIVADHGRNIKLSCLEKLKNAKDIAFFNPLLMYKDFNSHGQVYTDNSLHTNADVPYLATLNLNISTENPFTGKKFRNASEFDSFNVYEVANWNPKNMIDRTQFPLKGKKAYNVHDNIFDESNWTILDTSEAAK